MAVQVLTGYPSIDKPWLKYYKLGAEQEANSIPEGKTVWDVIEERLHQYEEIPAIEYFGRKISRPEFIDLVYTWARAFKALGVREDEVVPYYGPFFPDIGAMAFALNMIGACPYFLKLAINPKALEEETRDARIAVVYDGMWQNVSGEFSKDRFEKILVATVTDAMPFPKKQIVSLLAKLKTNQGMLKIPRGGKYISLAKAKEYAKQYHGEVRTVFVPNRAAFITSSSGTTVGGVVKGTVATNESTISQLLMGSASDIQYFPGDKCLNHFPPTASTSLNCLFFLALFNGMTVLMDPRVSEKDFYSQIIEHKPNIVLTTGSAWEAFFHRVESEINQGKVLDLSCAKGWTIGGEGTTISNFKKWNEIVIRLGGTGLFSGYGLSELFSAASVEKIDVRCDLSRKVLSVGLPYAGITMGVFDKDGTELTYNHRGELRIRSRAAMKEYYRKPELTAKTKVDGWIHTGDLAEIDENGFVYILGRCNDSITLSDGQIVYLFDVVNKIKESDCLDDAMILIMPSTDGQNYLVAHIVWNGQLTSGEKKNCIAEMNRLVTSSFPEEIQIAAYSEHEGMLPYSPTTLKKDRNRLSKQTDGYMQVVDGVWQTIRFEANADNTAYTLRRQ